MTDVLTLDNKDVERLVEKICVEIDNDGFLPDIVVGVGRGGAIPAVMISHYFDIPYVSVSRNSSGEENESNCWLPEDAYNGKNILVVDDVCNTGSTLEDMCDDWDLSIRGLENHQRWCDHVKFAALVVKDSCEFFVEYGAFRTSAEVVELPWERWWG